jgi:hypothetical protein
MHGDNQTRWLMRPVPINDLMYCAADAYELSVCAICDVDRVSGCACSTQKVEKSGVMEMDVPREEYDVMECLQSIEEDAA